MVKISHLLVINVPASKVFNNLSTIKGLASWWTKDTTGSPKKGGEIRFAFGKEYNIMKVTESIKDRLVVWECIYSSFPFAEEWIGTNQLFNLSEDKDKNTIVKFEHTGWKEYNDFFANCNFHWGKYMMSQKLLCETGKGNPDN